MSSELPILAPSHVHDEHMVSVAGFRDPTEAQFAKGMLDAAGIETILQGENANDLYPGVLRVRLLVKREDEEAARALLTSAAPAVDSEE